MSGLGLRTVRARVAAAALAAALLGQSGCGIEGTAEDPRVADVPGDSGADVPDVCRDAFVLAFGGDPDSVTLRPSDWPDPFADAVPCNVSATAGNRQNVSYAVDATRAEILDGFEAALAGLPGYDVGREESAERGYELITGMAGDVGFQIDTELEGGYTLTFGR